MASPCPQSSARGRTRLPDKRKTSGADTQQDCGPLCPPPEGQMLFLHTRTRPQGSSRFSPRPADSLPGWGGQGAPWAPTTVRAVDRRAARRSSSSQRLRARRGGRKLLPTGERAQGI